MPSLVGRRITDENRRRSAVVRRPSFFHNRSHATPYGAPESRMKISGGRPSYSHRQGYRRNECLSEACEGG